MRNIVKSRWFTPIVTSFAALGAGIVIGHILSRRNKDGFVHELPDGLSIDFDPEMLDQLKQNSRLLLVEEEDDDDDDDDDGPGFEVVVEEHIRSEESKTIEFGESANGEWNYAEEVAKRTPKGIYPIHEDEYYANESEYPHSCITYYAGDDIMVDEDLTPIFDYQKITGPLKFGYGAKNAEVMFVRNCEREIEFEISLNPGFYAVEVLDMEIEDADRDGGLRHAHGVPKFRDP